ncbi:hypothetical protein PFISCL1PPCAC_9258, partial [Pristionchus fissidentatus]
PYSTAMTAVVEESPTLEKNPLFPVTVQYCGECTMPFEYCEYSGMYDRCKKWAESHASTLMDGLTVSGEEKKVEGATVVDDNAEAPAADGDKKHQKRGGKGGGGGGKKEEKKKRGVVTVQRAPRGKKSVTVVKGLSGFDIDLKVAAKFFASKFACGSSVTGTDEIVIQGDVKDDLFDLIPGKWATVTEEDIEDLGDQKR